MVAGLPKVNPSTGPGSHSRGFAHKTVIITGITDDGRITCKDNFGREIMVNASVQRAKGLPPEVGERWMIDRDLGGWSLTACLSVPPTPPEPVAKVITFESTNGSNPGEMAVPNFTFQWASTPGWAWGDPTATWCYIDPDDPTKILFPVTGAPRLICVMAAWTVDTFTAPPTGSHVEWIVLQGDLLLLQAEGHTENWVGPETWGFTAPLWTVRKEFSTTYPVAIDTKFALSVWTNAPGAYGGAVVRICDLGGVAPVPS